MIIESTEHTHTHTNRLTREEMVIEHSGQSNDSFVSVVAEVVDDELSEAVFRLHKHGAQLALIITVLQCAHCEGMRV